MAKLRTYQEWNERGRYVKKGEKALEFNRKGVALFSKQQTQGKQDRSGWVDYECAGTTYSQSKDWDCFDSAIAEH